jgi:hypothetical protein
MALRVPVMLRAFSCFLFTLSWLLVAGQNKCPENIGFDKGSFDGWECFKGTINKMDGAILLAPSPPSADPAYPDPQYLHLFIWTLMAGSR